MTGASPFFDVKKQYEVEVTDQFQEYMRSQVLQIDVIDEAVDIIRASDFVGRVRIPLAAISLQGTSSELSDCFPLKDEAGQETGRMEVKIIVKEAQNYTDTRKGDQFVVSKFTEREVVTKIAAKFAESLMESIDLIFDMLIEPGNYESNKISKQRFKDYVLSITDQLKDQEIDILLKTHQLLQGKDYIELGDFRTIFEMPVQQAKQKKLEELAARDQSYRQAT